jgi:hypothetical protein
MKHVKQSNSGLIFSCGMKMALGLLAATAAYGQTQLMRTEATPRRAGSLYGTDVTTRTSSVPKMPPMASNPKRDAAPSADAVTKAQIKSQVQAQIGAIQHAARSSTLKAPENNSPEIQVLERQKAFVQSLLAQAGPGRGQQNSTPARILPSRDQAHARLSPIQHAAPPTQICVAPQIHAVNGKSSGVVFTQDPAYNDYFITGCGFGSQPGQAYLSGVAGGQMNLVVKQWSDTQLEVMVEPGLSGVPDGLPDLILVRAGGSVAKLPNCRFYAQRKSVLLSGIPRQYANLMKVAVGDSTHGFGTMYCPGPDVDHLFPCLSYNAGAPLDGISNGHDHRNDPNQSVSNAVDRDGGQLPFDAGEDVYDLSKLAPGFAIDYSTVHWYDWTRDVCEGWAGDAFPKKPGDSVSYETKGHYRSYLKTRNSIAVDWGVDHCAWRWLGIFKVNDWYNSGYSLEVHVKGPMGVDPWTGHPVSVARNTLNQQPHTLLRQH